MGLTQKYFNLVYNPVYDFTTGRLNRYQKLQSKCVSKLQLHDNDAILCVGLGTGNEIGHILRANKNVNITGVDYSDAALRKARKKSLKWGKEITTVLMDARHLQFPDASFDKTFCFHVLDFIDDGWKATSEMLRVLKSGGQFVITYPSQSEGRQMAFKLMQDNFRQNLKSGKNRLVAILESLIQVASGMVYIPLIFRSKKRFYSREEITNMLSKIAGKSVPV